MDTTNYQNFRIDAENICVDYNGKVALYDANLRLKPGQICGLVGMNGAGKTTFFNAIVGLVKPNSGKVFLNNSDITKLPMYKRARKGMGYLPQEPSIFTGLSVKENILSVLEMMGNNKSSQIRKCNFLISDFKLEKVKDSIGSTLSGGERRRTEIARALACDPKFILLDEPFAGVDPIAVEEIQNIILKLKNKNIGVLLTDHNVHETLSITDRSYLLFDGKILKSGTSEELSKDEFARKFYLGDKFELR